MSNYYSHPPPPRQPWSKQPWLLLAHAMARLLCLTLVDHMALVNSRHLATERQARQRHDCGLLPQRLLREQCLATLMPMSG